MKVMVLNVHGGITEEIVNVFMEEVRNSMEPCWVFFDEINTSDTMGLFKEILCDRIFQGEPLPKHITFLAACNPYKVAKQEQEKVGLVFR